MDSLAFANYKGKLESVFAKSQIVSGAAMLGGSVSGGVIAQATDLSVPYVIRALILVITFGVAWRFMKDWGFERAVSLDLKADFKKLFVKSFSFGWQRPAIRWIMLSAPIISGVSFYAFYAMQPYLLELYGNPDAYAIAGLVAAIVAGAQIIGGISTPLIRRWFQRRTTIMVGGALLGAVCLWLIGLTSNFGVAIVLLSMWGLLSAAVQPIRQAYLNQLIPSSQRATVLSFDVLLGSSGGIAIQPALGRVADIGSYAASFLVGAGLQAAAVPFILLARLQHSPADEQPK